MGQPPSCGACTASGPVEHRCECVQRHLAVDRPTLRRRGPQQPCATEARPGRASLQNRRRRPSGSRWSLNPEPTRRWAGQLEGILSKRTQHPLPGIVGSLPTFYTCLFQPSHGLSCCGAILPYCVLLRRVCMYLVRWLFALWPIPRSGSSVHHPSPTTVSVGRNQPFSVWLQSRQIPLVKTVPSEYLHSTSKDGCNIQISKDCDGLGSVSLPLSPFPPPSRVAPPLCLLHRHLHLLHPSPLLISSSQA
jgi:hypothetical protein